MQITQEEIQLAYSLLSDVNQSTNKEREFELKGIIKGMLIKKYNDKKNDICRIEFDFSRGQVQVLQKV